MSNPQFFAIFGALLIIASQLGPVPTMPMYPDWVNVLLGMLGAVCIIAAAGLSYLGK